MDDRLRETLSAMMDDEADELSVRRLLSHENQGEVSAQWQRWQNINDLMHRGGLTAGRVDVSASVRQALDGYDRPQPPLVATERGVPKPWRWPAAAMVAMALVVGFGAGAGWESEEASARSLASTPATESAGARPDDSIAAVQEVTLQGLDQEQWKHMSRYLLEHAQHNSVGAGQGSMGYARLVSVSDGY